MGKDTTVETSTKKTTDFTLKVNTQGGSLDANTIKTTTSPASNNSNTKTK